MFNAGSNRGITMSKEYVTFLKSGGYMRITEYSEEESLAVEHREQRIWMKKEGLLRVSEPDMEKRMRDKHPINTETEMKQYAPSRSRKARLVVFLRNLGIAQWEWSL